MSNLDKKITFCINTSRNEKPYVTLLMESLLNGINVNLHDILIFIDSDNQNTTEFLIQQKSLFPNLTIVKNNGDPIGYGANINWMFQKAKTQIVSYLQSDNIICLSYDQCVLKHLDANTVVSSTRIEPPFHSQFDNEITYVKNFGLTPDEFNYEQFLKFAETKKESRTINHFFAPFTLYKECWNKINGHDFSFIKSREDSDVAVRLLMSGVKLKQSFDAIVYHFSCTSSRGIEWWKPENQTKDIIRKQNDAIELNRFITKWGEFIHPNSFEQVGGFDKNKIIVNNPPIDESKFKIL